MNDLPRLWAAAATAGDVDSLVGLYSDDAFIHVVFTSDNIFHKVQTWLQEANPDLWLMSLESLRKLPEEIFVPGHGDLCGKAYLNEQGAFIQEWKEYVKKGIERGMTKDEAIANLTAMTDRYPMDVGQDGMSPMVMKMNVANLYDYFTGAKG